MRAKAPSRCFDDHLAALPQDLGQAVALDQRIPHVHRQCRQAFSLLGRQFLPLLCGDVTDEGREHRRSLDRDPRYGQLHRELGAVRAHCGQLDPTSQDRALARGKEMGQASVVGIAESGRDDQLGDLGTDRPVARVAEGPLRRRVELDDPPPVVHDDHGVERGFEDGRLAGLEPSDRLGRPLGARPSRQME